MSFNIDEIKQKFKEVISYSQGIANPKVDKLFDIWLKSKKKFIDMMDGELIYEYPKKVSFTLDTKSRNKLIQDLIDTVNTHWDNPDLADFIDAMRDGFFDNKTLFDYDYKGVKIKKGTKIIKSFKHFEDHFKVLEDIQNYASRIIQEDKVEGTLCFSVHPLDFLSSSENTHNWRSCHALDGEYRSGNLSYMVDSSTVICYLKSDEDEKLPNFPFPWNSKKWRVLLFYSDDWSMIMAGRQYPFMTTTGLDFISKNILSQFDRKKFDNEDRSMSWSPWFNKYIQNIDLAPDHHIKLYNRYIPIGKELRAMKDIVIDNDSLHYNDLLYSTCYLEPYYMYRTNKWWFFSEYLPVDIKDISEVKFYIGGKVPCLECETEEIDNSEQMLCYSCKEDYCEVDDSEVCEICGRTLYYDRDNISYVHGLAVCEHCYETETAVCDVCGQRDFIENVKYDKETDRFICRFCREE